MELFRDIIESSMDLISTAYPDGRLMYLNRAGFRLVGWSEREDISDRMIGDLHPAWAFEIISRQGIPKTLIDGGWRGETALLHRDGHEIPVSQIIIPHRGNDGQIIYLSTIMRDITQRKQAENAVNQSKNQLQALIDVS
ncbi:MAG: PAS domain S-box protein, partial [Candidatus Delongbacteria bacterium]|nr:PAS domain S-box protein [Candidatus Delongbacteria bacterium]